MPVSSDLYKRQTASLYTDLPDKVVDISENWRKRFIVPNSQAHQNTFERICVAASNINREPEDGCMKKIKIERSLKLRKEDVRSKNYNIITCKQSPEENWINSFEGQKEKYYLQTMG